MEEKLGIWENKECIQCGACCYDLNKILNNLELESCPFPIIKDNKCCCKIYEDKGRAWANHSCDGFFCGNLNRLPTGYEIKERLRKIAFKLGTAPKNFRIDTKV